MYVMILQTGNLNFKIDNYERKVDDWNDLVIKLWYLN